MSSLKVNNTITSYLKIFFERSNKLNNTVSSFGNVFKNSKWSDFQTQNIKKSFSKEWFLLALVVIIPVVLFWYFKSLPLVQLLILVHVTKQVLCDLVYDFYYLLIYLSFTQLQWWQSSPYSQGDKKKLDCNASYSIPTVTFSSPALTNNIYSKTKLTFTSNNFLQLTHNITTPLSKGTNSSYSNIFSTLSGKDSIFNPYLNTLNSSNYVLSTKLNPLFNTSHNFTPTHNYAAKNFLHKNPYLSTYLTDQLLRSTKQYRWLTKNFLNTSHLNSNSHKITQSKSLLTNNEFDLTKAHKNLWVSNTIDNLSPDAIRSFNTPDITILKPYNFYENSRFFTNMRFFNLVNFSTLLLTGTTKSQVVNSGDTFTLNPTFLQNQNIQNLDFNFNMSTLNPETGNNLRAIQSTQSNKLVSYETQVFALVPEVFNYTTLEMLSYTNTNSLNLDNTWPNNTQTNPVNSFKI